jgi:cell division protein FtsQ
VFVVPVLAIAAMLVGGLFLSRSSALHARAIDVTGASHLSRAQVVAAAQVSLRSNVLWFDQDAAEARLEMNPWVQAADVGLSLPWTIQITIVERTPVAVAMEGARTILVAGDGTLLGPATRAGALPRITLPTAPVFEGLTVSPAPAARAVGSFDADLRSQVANLTVGSDGTLAIRLHGGVTVEYGSASEVRRKAEALRRILDWAEREGAILRTVNVVAPDLPAVRLAT